MFLMGGYRVRNGRLGY